ncbi:MAG: 50S ribosomal protein L21 [Patescibacteria group bacterium]
MKKFAVIETGGKQYRVSVGDTLKVEKLKTEDGGSLVFDALLKVDGDKVEIGTPYLAGEKVEAKVLGQGRGEKKIIFRYHSKTRYRKKKGHRQPFTELEIIKI